MSHGLLAAMQMRPQIVVAIHVQICAGGATTKQMYVRNNITGSYLSEAAQIDLGLIPPGFPRTKSHHQPSQPLPDHENVSPQVTLWPPVDAHFTKASSPTTPPCPWLSHSHQPLRTSPSYQINWILDYPWHLTNANTKHSHKCQASP